MPAAVSASSAAVAKAPRPTARNALSSVVWPRDRSVVGSPRQVAGDKRAKWSAAIASARAAPEAPSAAATSIRFASRHASSLAICDLSGREQAMSRARVRLARYASTETMNAPQLVAAISPSSRAKTRATEARDSGDHTWMTVVHTTGGRAVTKPVRLPRTTLAAVKAMVEPRTSAVL